MLINLRYQIELLRHPRSRADEVRAVRRRLTLQPGPDAVSEEELRIARELCRLRATLAAAFARVESCKNCVRPRSPSWPGGHCCSGRTEHLFTDHELGALRLSGTRPSSLRLPLAAHVGCAFRGPAGCSLEPADRPFLCVRYTCRELESELDARAERSAISRLQAELRAGFERFVACRMARLERELFAEIWAELG
jgi:hypothetical protein